MNDQSLETSRKRRIRRNAILLGALALAFYAAYIFLNIHASAANG